ncbi:WAP four-disulfide core domain protein 8 [Rhynchonycteris naso]
MLLDLMQRTSFATWGKRPPPRHSSTFCRRNVALLLLISLSLEQTCASPRRRVHRKPGVCRKERLTCRANLPDMCKEDLACDGYMKCCSFGCRKRCMDPYEEPCMLPADPGNCKNGVEHWHFDLKYLLCKPFKYGGCGGNSNNFLSMEDCMKACSSTVKKGRCPLFPSESRMECPGSCKSDNDCPGSDKCCKSMCGFVCSTAWAVKPGFCPQKLPTCLKIAKPKCQKDEDCPVSEKCCSQCGLKCLDSAHLRGNQKYFY